ncbi:hypothetical protein J6590_067064 [Homalodisca vitripennis]|nr:hypothetical protein J6590_067064 [Homalodisca vitripennis]
MTVWECHKVVKLMAKTNTFILTWVPGHRGITSNERADSCANLGANCPLTFAKWVFNKNRRKTEGNVQAKRMLDGPLKNIVADAFRMNDWFYYGSLDIPKPPEQNMYSGSGNPLQEMWEAKRKLQCEQANTTEFSPPWLSLAVPYRGDPLQPAWCDRYGVNLAINTTAQLCSSEMFLTNVTQTCNQWVFESKEKTIATEFKLFCEENIWRRTMVGTVNNLGLITNYIIVCYLSDRFGRKSALLTLTLVQGLLVILQSFSPSYSTFILLEYLVCFCSTFNSAFVLAIEMVGGDKRMFANCLMNTLYSLGEVVVAIIMWWVQDYRVLLRFIGAIKLVNILYLCAAEKTAKGVAPTAPLPSLNQSELRWQCCQTALPADSDVFNI